MSARSNHDSRARLPRAGSSAQAQQGAVTGNRLMFDPSGLQGSDSRTGTVPLSPTTGQSTTPKQPEAPAVRRTAAPQPPTPPTAKPVAAPKRATASAPARPAAARSAAPETERNRAVSDNARPIPREQPAALGRISIPGGSLGYESETQIKAYDMSDGRRVPGYENIQRNDPSYFGLSLRVPTGSQSAPSLFRSHAVD